MIADLFYSMKPLIPRWLQIELRRALVGWTSGRSKQSWPIWEPAATPPPAWPGWPGKKRFALVLTHDVELDLGVSRCEAVADLEEQRGFRSAFAFVPLRYQTPPPLRRSLAKRGFEIMVHDLHHDGKLYRDREHFSTRRGSINEVLREWGVRGFASGAMHHHLAWISELEIDYDVSTYDVDPFEPQCCGLGRIFPYWVQSPSDSRGYVEIPYTLPQDFTLFVLMRERNNRLWREKLDWIAARGGMALVKTHPDYMALDGKKPQLSEYPVEFYTDLLDYVGERYGDEVWLAHPSEIARYWRTLSAGTEESGAIIPQDTFCQSCRQAHATGWLRQYPGKAAPGSSAPVTHAPQRAGQKCP